jgi:hypothetical protein
MGTMLQRSFLLGLAGLLAIGAACFIEPAPPAGFRFECSADVECDVGQRCASGLCQQPCGSDLDADCPQDAPVCLNGYCSSACLVADPQCTDPQTCLSFSVPGEEPPETGVCVVRCGDAAPCPDAQVCYDEIGLCVATCMTTDECAAGEECVTGICLPASGG